MLRKLHNLATKALALEDVLPEGLRHELETFTQDTTPLNPSFSAANWHNFSTRHGHKFRPPLTDDYEVTMQRLPEDKTPVYDLPLSFHKRAALNAWQWMEVYGEKGEQAREVGTLRLLEPFLVPLIALFRGRLIDKPEQPMPATEESTGGQVEHEVFLIGGALFFIIELKLHLSGAALANYVAQLFLEILSAVRRNSKYDLKNLKVYGLLSDFSTFKFYSYNPETRTFSHNSTMWVGVTRESVCTEMIEVVNKIFGILLTGYIASLEVITKTSRVRGESLDFSPESSSPFTVTNGSSEADDGSRKSTLSWDMALHFARLCQSKFNEDADTLDSECAEGRGIKALGLLDKSASQIPRSTSFSGELDIPTHDELSSTLSDMVTEKYKAILKKRYRIQSHSGTKRKFGDI